MPHRRSVPSCSRRGFALAESLVSASLLATCALVIARPLTTGLRQLNAAAQSDARVGRLADAASVLSAALRRAGCAAPIPDVAPVTVTRTATAPVGVQLKLQLADRSGPGNPSIVDSVSLWVPCTAATP